MAYFEAQNYIQTIDNERDLFVEHIAGRKIENSDFDIVFNYATMIDDHIVDAIVNVAKNKKIIL